MAINQITKIIFPDPMSPEGFQEVALTDWSDRPLYSMADLFSGFTDEEIRLFSYNEGQNVVNTANMTDERQATLVDTNISAQSELDTTENFLLYAIALEVFEWQYSEQAGVGTFTIPNGGNMPTAPNQMVLHNRLICELDVSGKPFPQAGFGWFAQGFGPTFGAVFGDAATLRTFANNGNPTAEARYMQSIPVHIGGTEDYNLLLINSPGTAVNFVTEAGATDANRLMQVRAYLVGLHRRPVGAGGS